MEDLNSFINENQPEFENTFKHLISLKGISANAEGIDETVDYLTQLLKHLLKAEVETIPTAGNPIILATLHGGGAQTMLLYGHYDVMEPGDRTQWQSNPFELTNREKRYYARGAGDNKGQLMAQIFGIYTYLQIHGSLPFSIKLLIEGEEEQGSHNLAPTVKKLKDQQLQDVDFAVVIDGSFNADGTHVLRLGNRGLLAFELSATTGQQANHSGNLGNVMANAATELLKVLDQLYDKKADRVLIPNFYQGVSAPSADEQKLLEKLPYDAEQIQQQSKIFNLKMTKQQYYRALMFDPTFNINSFTAGYQGPGIKTVIPNTARVKIDCRLVGKQDPETIFNSLKEKIAENNFINLKKIGSIPPTRTPVIDPRVAILYDAIKAAAGSAYIEPVMPGTVPNYVWTDILQVPAFTIPYANYDQHNHDFNENIMQAAFLDGIRISYEIINHIK